MCAATALPVSKRDVFLRKVAWPLQDDDNVSGAISVGLAGFARTEEKAN
jgi:hypothetical protein